MKFIKISLHKIFLSTILTSILFSACKKDERITPNAPISHQIGEIHEIRSMGVFSPNEIQQILDESGAIFPFELSYGIEAFSLDYYSINARGEMILVSGALFIPQCEDELPLLSIQHGTQSKSDLVASVSPQNSVEGMIGLMAASMGYITTIPDYPGFGISHTSHPYMHAASLIPSVLDLMSAAKTHCSENQIKLNSQVFLTGYSEGGFLSLATQKTIENHYSNDYDLTAVAPISGPYDLTGMIDTIFKSNSYGNPAYIAWFFTAYNDIYGWDRLDDIMNAPYAEMSPGLFDGSHGWGQIESQLPSEYDKLIHPGFRDSYLNGNEAKTRAAVAENTLLDWVPQAPVHFIHGDADQIVPYENATTAFSRFTANGAESIQLSNIPGGTHASSGPAAINLALEWFETF